MKFRGTVSLLISFAIALLAVFGTSVLQVRSQQPNRVGLVVDLGDHHITRCVEFDEPEITGYDVLRRASLDVVADTSNPLGIIVCDINDTSGCSASDCFCQCQGSPCFYWAYHHLVDGSWQYSQLGASSRKLQHGDVDGWAWGEGSLNTSGAEPPLLSFEEICAPPPTDTPPPPPQDTPVPQLEVWFRLDHNPIEAGSCTTVRWDTAHAREVYLDGEPVSRIGSREVCPLEPQDYVLRVVGAEDEEIHTLTLGVTGEVPPSPTPTPEITAPTSTPTPTATPPSASPTPQPTATPSPSPTPELTPSPSPTRAEPSPTPTSPDATQVAQPQSLDQPPGEAAEPASPYQPLDYVVFGLIAAGLLGWLIFLAKVRR
ncbi:MAG: hypothetical protein ACOC7Y_01355 [Chloroflexota bacterium]